MSDSLSQYKAFAHQYFIMDNNQSNIVTTLRNALPSAAYQIFIDHFHMYLTAKPGDLVVDLDDVCEWIGYEYKHHAKRDIINKIDTAQYSIAKCVRSDDAGRGGHNKEKIMLTTRGFKHLCMLAGTSKGEEVRNYYIDMEEVINEHMRKQVAEQKMLLDQQQTRIAEQKVLLDKKTQEVIDIAAERDLMKDTLNSKVAYVWQTDSRHGEPFHLKIGVTGDCCQRIKPYRQTHRFGRLVRHFELPLEANCITIEKYIFHTLRPFSMGGENFKCSIDTACLVMSHVLSTHNLTTTLGSNETELQQRLQASLHSLGVEGISGDKPGVCEVAIQTDDIALGSTCSAFTTTVAQQYAETFDRFVSERCEVNNSAEVATTAITGAYRIWCGKAEKEAYFALLDYLKTRFREVRLTVQNEERVVNGYRGVALRSVQYNMSAVPSDVELFLFQECKFVPEGKAIIWDLVEEFRKWRARMGKSTRDLQRDRKEVMEFLKNSPHAVQSMIHIGKESAQGFYGIQIKSQSPQVLRRTSATSKPVFKKDKTTHEIINQWTTIAKAAAAEGMPPAKLSRILKLGMDNDGAPHYFCTTTL